VTISECAALLLEYMQLKTQKINFHIINFKEATSFSLSPASSNGSQ